MEKAKAGLRALEGGSLLEASLSPHPSPATVLACSAGTLGRETTNNSAVWENISLGFHGNSLWSQLSRQLTLQGQASPHLQLEQRKRLHAGLRDSRMPRTQRLSEGILETPQLWGEENEYLEKWVRNPRATPPPSHHTSTQPAASASSVPFHLTWKVSPAAAPLGRWANRGLAGICVACPLVPDPVSTHLSPPGCLSPTPSSQSVGPQGPPPGQSLRSRGWAVAPKGRPPPHPGQQELVSPESSLSGAWLAVLFLPILLREKGRLREGTGVAQSHTAPK